MILLGGSGLRFVVVQSFVQGRLVNASSFDVFDFSPYFFR